MKKKKVLVTGGCGFIGSEVVRQLLKKEYSVIVVDNFSNSTPLQEFSSFKLIDFDLTKSKNILELFNSIDYCIHLAARVGGIKYMDTSQSEILKDNILIDLNVISAANQTNTKIVYASTVIVYDQIKKPPFKENQLFIAPRSNYGFTKLVGERLCESFGKEGSLKYSIARISNVYGINFNEIPVQKLHVIPDLIRKILTEKTLSLIGGGKQVRAFIHVSDIANALIIMMENEKANGEAFNTSSVERYQILELAKLIWGLMRKEPFNFEIKDFIKEDFMDNSTDISKIKRLLDWQTKETLIDNLPEIVKWYSKKNGTSIS